ncbi:MAG: AAA family ATPase [Pseudomonadota bacterium]
MTSIQNNDKQRLESKKSTSLFRQIPVYTHSMECRIDPEFVRKNRGVCIYPDSPEIEYYKILRTRIQQQSKERKMNTIMITSPNRNEGKTTTVINMGLVFAREFNQTVLLVDCDFKGQDIHKYLGIKNDYSLIDYFLHGIPLSDLIVWPGIEKLTLISGNKTVLNSSEMLSSEVMQQLVVEMGTRYDDRYVFFDAPPVLERSEAISMAPMMDGILMVVEAGVTSKKDVEKAIKLLPREKFLGFVLNKKY